MNKYKIKRDKCNLNHPETKQKPFQLKKERRNKCNLVFSPSSAIIPYKPEREYLNLEAFCMALRFK